MCVGMCPSRGGDTDRRVAAMDAADLRRRYNPPYPSFYAVAHRQEIMARTSSYPESTDGHGWTA